MAVHLTDLAGQELAARTLGSAIAHDRLHHAYLFAGPDGSGKFTAAKLLAQILMCEDQKLHQTEPDAACGVCPGCLKVTTTGHADVHLLETDEKMLKVDALREAMQALTLRPREGRFRILIIRDADKMNPQAQNAILKTLEEPPGSARLILTASRPQSILVTVLSRCQKIIFLPVPIAAIAKMLAEKKNIPLERAQLLAALAQGSPGRALEADLEAVVTERDRMGEIDGALDPGNPESVTLALKAAEELNEESDKLAGRLDLLSVWLRDQMVLALGSDPTQVANLDRENDLRQLAGRRGLTEILRRARLLEDARLLLGQPYNYNLLMIIEQLCLGFAGHAAGASG